MVVASPDRLRRDAKGNRRAILDAARALFANSADVAMCQVARRAGVGQATLYRNFPSRDALAAELLEERFEQIATDFGAASDDPDAFFTLLGRLVEGIAGLLALSELARDRAEGDSRLARTRLRIADLMSKPLAEAKSAGTLRADTSMDDVFLILRMARGAMDGVPGRSDRLAIADRLAVLLRSGLSR